MFEQGTCTQKVGTSDDGAHLTKYVSNEDIMTFLKQLEQRFDVKWKYFDQRLEAVDTRLKALASLETKVQSFEKELKGITTYVYKNVKSNTESITELNEKIKSMDFEISMTNTHVPSLADAKKQA